MKNVNDMENDKKKIKNALASGWMFPKAEHKLAVLQG